MSENDAEGYARGSMVIPAASSVDPDAITLLGVHVYDGATGETVVDLVRDEESGELVKAEPGQGIRGVTLNAGGGRWVTEDELDPHQLLDGLTEEQIAAIDTHDWPLASSGQVTCRRCGWPATVETIGEIPPCQR